MDTLFLGQATRYQLLVKLLGANDLEIRAVAKPIAVGAATFGIFALWHFGLPRGPFAGFASGVALVTLFGAFGALLHFNASATSSQNRFPHSYRSAHRQPPQARNFEMEDLLQREYIRADADGARAVVEGRVVLVTGAGGSIGSELCRQIAAAGPLKLVLLDKSENGLFYANMDCSERMSASRVVPRLVDLLDRKRVEQIIKAERPEVIFHAAAHKHVGMLELYPQEAIRNNVLGTRNIAEAALQFGAGCFVNISTDKAVAPSNYMGLSKKLTESLIRELARTNGTASTRFANVRFGNVAGSTGSVLRLFRDRIHAGRPLSVTDPRATRFFMSVSEAVYLILQAAAMGCSGETFVFDMGVPLNIYELAKAMIGHAGLTPGVDIPIEFTGLRAGEKIDEALWEKWENPALTGSDRVLVIRAGDPAPADVLSKIRKMEEIIFRGDDEGLLQYVGEIFPAFSSRRLGVIPPVPPLPMLKAVAAAGGA